MGPAKEAEASKGMTREAARERARQLRHKVSTTAREVTVEQERKRLLIHQQLERLRVPTPQYAAPPAPPAPPLSPLPASPPP